MTSLIAPSYKPRAFDLGSVTSLQDAVGEITKATLERHASWLQNRPSPASLASAPTKLPEKLLDEELFDALARVKILTAQVAMHLERTWRDKLFRQLDSLHDPAEWEHGDAPLRQLSFSTFLKAILSIKPVRRPGLGLSHSGNLIASWTTARDRLTIEFLPDDRVRWVLTRYRDDETERVAGQMLVARLAEGLQPYAPERWFNESQNSESAR
jgi:hypothetical protein